MRRSARACVSECRDNDASRMHDHGGRGGKCGRLQVSSLRLAGETVTISGDRGDERDKGA